MYIDNICIISNPDTSKVDCYWVSLEGHGKRGTSPHLDFADISVEGVDSSLYAGLIHVKEKRATLEQYLLRCKLCGKQTNLGEIIQHHKGLNMLKMTYSELVSPPKILNSVVNAEVTMQQYDRVMCDNVLYSLLVRSGLTFDTYAKWSYDKDALYYNFEHDAWISVHKLATGSVGIKYIRYKSKGNEIYNKLVGTYSMQGDLNLDMIKEDLGCGDSLPNFFRLDSYFPLALQVYLKNPINLGMLSNEIFTAKPPESKTGRKSIGFFVLDFDVLNSLLEFGGSARTLGAYSWGISRLNWRDERLQSIISKYF